jgi:hypothetical protein
VISQKKLTVYVAIIAVLLVILWFRPDFKSNAPSAPQPQPVATSVATSGTATERALCAALDGDPETLVTRALAVGNDAEAFDTYAGSLLVSEGALLQMYLGMTNNAAKVQEEINAMKETCAGPVGG